jgi:long-chain acyl-CoA synthetase
MNISRLFDIPYHQLANYPLQESIVGKPGGKLIKYSTKQLVEQAQALSLGLIEIGVKPGDRVATIVYNSRPEWHVLDIALLQIGAVNVPVYPTISPREYVYIFNDAAVKFCFVGEGDLLEKAQEAQKQVYSLKEIFTFHEHADAPHWASLMSHSTDFTELEALKANVKPTDLATIIYTSGTTGNPKGVMLSHDNICSNVREVVKILPLKAGQQAFSFLPLCHIFERTVTYTYMAVGVKIRYAESIDTLRDELGEVKPHFFSSVPRLLEKVYERIVNTAMSDKPYKRKIFLWAVKLTEKYEIGKELNLMDKIQFVLADKLVFSKIRARLGGNVVGIVTGAAACPRKIAQFFSAAGISIREGYGLTETSPVISVNLFDNQKAQFGTVGPILPGVEVKIDDSDGSYAEGEGEILCKGPNVMLGYYNNDTATDEVIKNGWFYTGDIGKFVTNAHGVQLLKITDRKKELLKTSNGKYIAPAPIETRFKEEFLIEQVMVIGNNEKFAAALIIPSVENLKLWCSENDVNFSNLKEVVENESVIKHYQAIIDQINPEFAHVEQIKKFKLLPTTWDVNSGELTPTMKLKRRVIMENHAAEIRTIYC